MEVTWLDLLWGGSGVEPGGGMLLRTWEENGVTGVSGSDESSGALIRSTERQEGRVGMHCEYLQSKLTGLGLRYQAWGTKGIKLWGEC